MVESNKFDNAYRKIWSICVWLIDQISSMENIQSKF